MNYILLAKDKETKKEYRFFNPITEDDAKKLFVPKNCRLVKEGDVPAEEILKIPLINDGITPLTFDVSEAFVEYSVDKRAGNIVIAVTLLVTGYCQSGIMKKSSFSASKAEALQERLELLQEKAVQHRDLLNSFIESEKGRENPFVLTDNVIGCYENIKKSKNEMLSAVEDIENLLGSKEVSIISEFKSAD